jgi:hypothetical protein
LLNENSCSVAEEAENVVSLIWMSFFVWKLCVADQTHRDVSIPG